MIKRLCAIGWVFTGVIVAAMVAQGDLPPARCGAAERRTASWPSARPCGRCCPSGCIGADVRGDLRVADGGALVADGELVGAGVAQPLPRLHPAGGRATAKCCGSDASPGCSSSRSACSWRTRVASVADALTMLLQFSAIMGVVVWGGIFWRRANVAGRVGRGRRAVHPVAPVRARRDDDPRFCWNVGRPWRALPAWIGMYGRAQYVPRADGRATCRPAS